MSSQTKPSVLTRRAFVGAVAAASTAMLAPRGQAQDAPSAPRIAMLCTSTAAMPSGEPTGLWLSELTTPYVAFRAAGLTVRMASVAGGAPPIDPRSRGPRGNEPSVARFEQSEESLRAFRSMPAIAILDPADHDAVFLCGGHGAMWDFREDPDVRRMVEAVDRAGGVVGAICHGPAGLLGAHRADGQPLVSGRRVTGFSNAEEVAVELDGAMPYLLEDALAEAGGLYEQTPAFEPHAVRDGTLVTGQNPASAGPTANLVLAALAEGDALRDPA